MALPEKVVQRASAFAGAEVEIAADELFFLFGDDVGDGGGVHGETLLLVVFGQFGLEDPAEFAPARPRHVRRRSVDDDGFDVVAQEQGRLPAAFPGDERGLGHRDAHRFEESPERVENRDIDEEDEGVDGRQEEGDVDDGFGPRTGELEDVEQTGEDIPDFFE